MMSARSTENQLLIILLHFIIQLALNHRGCTVLTADHGSKICIGETPFYLIKCLSGAYYDCQSHLLPFFLEYASFNNFQLLPPPQRHQDAWALFPGSCMCQIQTTSMGDFIIFSISFCHPGIFSQELTMYIVCPGIFSGNSGRTYYILGCKSLMDSHTQT